LTVLRKMGYMPALANNGLEAVSICRDKKVDLIFMDLQMPEMDGLEACQKIQGELGDESPVIVALTAFAMKEDRERCLAAGMQEHISKPFRTEEIEQVIRTFTTTFSS
ncbi:MAG: response regulator, partial [Bacteroidota bacterium]